MRPVMLTLALAASGSAHAAVVINEVMADPTGADTGLEWIELRNTDTSAAADISGFKIEAGTTTFGLKYTVPASTTIPAGGYLVIGDPNVTAATLKLATGTLGLANATSSADGVRLKNAGGTVVDTVIYGTPNSDTWVDDGGATATSLAPAPDEGKTLARTPDGVDTNASAADFRVATATMGAANPSPPTCVLGGTVRVNEFLSNPGGADANNEWIELYNTGGTVADVSNWTVESGTSSFSVSFTLPPGTTIPSQGFLVIGETNVTTAGVNAGSGLDLGNASTSSDGVRLVDCAGAPIDTVIYGTPNTEGWKDDSGAIATSFAPGDAKDGTSQARKVDGVDTNASANDWAFDSTPTPGAANDPSSDTGGDTDTDTGSATCSTGTRVRINELMSDPPGADAGNEYVELYNADSTAADLSGYNLVTGTQTFNDKFVFPSGTTLGPGQFLLIGQSLVPGADLIADAISLGNASSNSDAARLQDCHGAVVDTVVYGAPNTDGWVDDSGAPAVSLAAKPGSGQALARRDDGVDTDLSAADFALAAYPTPGLGNDSAPVDCGAAISGLKINEFLPNSVGSDADVGTDWVELYNSGSATITLTGWTIDRRTSSSWSGEAPLSGTLAAGEFLLVGGPNVPGVDLAVPGFDPPSGGGGDGLRVADCKGFAADTVVYGGNNADLIPDDSGAAATSVAPDPDDGESLQRVTDGYDTGASGVDFAIATSPSPGAPNPEIVPLVCVPSDGNVTLNEVVPDPDGTDEGSEWFELYNMGGDSASVAGWYVATATQTSGQSAQDVLLPGGTTIGAEGFLVVGGGNVDGVDVVADLGLGNGTDGDALVLYDCEGNRVDTVIYGKTNADGLLDDNGVAPTAAYGDPGSAISLARLEDGVDSDLAEDWHIDGSPTPGATNYTEQIVDTDPVDLPGCNCGGGPPTDGAPDGGGCATVPVAPVFAGLLALAGAFVRRRRGA